MVPDIQNTGIPTPSVKPPKNQHKRSDEQMLQQVSRELEASFVSEMLKSAGVGKSRDSFGGGAGEDGFASFLVSAQADEIVKAGGFGLAEKIFESLVMGAHDNE